MKILRPTNKNLLLAAKFLNENGLVSFPTETVYGLGGNAYSDEAVARIFECKKRSQFNPINVCYSSFEQAADDVEINDKAKLLAEKFLPGPLTIILKKKKISKISWLCSTGKETLGIRVPNNDVALNLLKHIDFPLAAPSANRSSELSTTTAQAVSQSLRGYDDLLILDGGPCRYGIESTIIDLSGDDAKILRKGAIPEEKISRLTEIKLITADHSKFSHYKPKKPLIINVSEVKNTDALLAFGVPLVGAQYCLNLSKNSDLTEAAQNLFLMLRKLDESDAERICVMPVPNTDIGIAINDRLQKAIS